jgi:hypothetical protein
MDHPSGLTRGGLSKRQYISDEGIELQNSTERNESKLLKIMPIFKYINSLLVKDTWYYILEKKTSNTPVDNGSSLNIPITIKIIALTNRTLIKTSVLGWFRVVVSFFECVDRGAGVTRVTIPTARYLALGKFLKNS